MSELPKKCPAWAGMKIIITVFLLMFSSECTADDWDDSKYLDGFGREVIHPDNSWWSITQYCVNGILFTVYQGGQDDQGSATMLQKPNEGGTIPCDDKKEWDDQRKKEQIKRDEMKTNNPQIVVPG